MASLIRMYPKISTSEAVENNNIVCAAVTDSFAALTNKEKFTTWHICLHCTPLSVIGSFQLYARQGSISSD